MNPSAPLIRLFTFATLGCLLGLGAVSAAPSRTQATQPDFTRGGKPDTSHDWTLGPTGLRGWVYGRKGQTSDARQILVTSVAKGSPADGILRGGDVVLGVGDQRFSDDARIQFAQAITAAEQEKGGGMLRLIRWRDGQTRNV